MTLVNYPIYCTQCGAELQYIQIPQLKQDNEDRFDQFTGERIMRSKHVAFESKCPNGDAIDIILHVM